jgi:osmotically-inducible protein OsmY
MNNFTGRRKYMKCVRQVIATNLFIVFSLVLRCQTITEITRVESDKDAAVSKAVKETFLRDKDFDLTKVNVKTTDGSVDLSGTFPSLNARRSIKLA